MISNILHTLIMLEYTLDSLIIIIQDHLLTTDYVSAVW